MKAKKFIVTALIALLTAIYGCGRPVQAKQQSDRRMNLIILVDRSDSVTAADRDFYLRWLMRDIYPILRPGDFVALGQFGEDALGDFEFLAEQRFPNASYEAPSLFSMGDDPVTLQNRCLDALANFENVELPQFENSVQQQLMRPPKDHRSCLVDAIGVVASRLAARDSNNVLVVFSDGLEACGGIDFENRPPQRNLVTALERSRRIPKLHGVDVYFVRKIDQRQAKRLGNSPAWIQQVTQFWSDFFQAARASLVRIGPDPTFVDRQATPGGSAPKSRCGL